MENAKTTSAKKHIPVLPEETISYVMPQADGVRRVIDGTIGYGGHSSLILNKNPDALLLGIDRDETALADASKRLAGYGNRAVLRHGDFSRLGEFADELGWRGKVDAILLDIGVSSPQIDTPERGFSFRFDAPLDMRMDPNSGLPSAADVVNSAAVSELTKIFREYGEIREARKLAEAIACEREKGSIATSGQLAEICRKTLVRHGRAGAPPAPTLPFQALRIAVNHELEELESALASAMGLLKEGGRLAVISFHSLEDRIVKRFFQDMAVSCKCPPGCPVCICGWKPKLRILTKKPITASERELAENPRAACAKLRCAERIGTEYDKTETTIITSREKTI